MHEGWLENQAATEAYRALEHLSHVEPGERGWFAPRPGKHAALAFSHATPECRGGPRFVPGCERSTKSEGRRPECLSAHFEGSAGRAIHSRQRLADFASGRSA